MDLPEEIFVVVSEHDHNIKEMQGAGSTKPFVVETNMPATKKRAEFMAKRLSASGYGESKIGRVVFHECDQVNGRKAVADLLSPEDNRIDELIDDLDSCDGRDIMKLAILEWLGSLQ